MIAPALDPLDKLAAAEERRETQAAFLWRLPDFETMFRFGGRQRVVAYIDATVAPHLAQEGARSMGFLSDKLRWLRETLARVGQFLNLTPTVESVARFANGILQYAKVGNEP